jgi:hypothetical protein
MTIVNTFKDHIQSVEKLMTFDDDVLSIAISNIEELQNKLLKLGINNAHISAQTTLTQLKGFRANKSLQPRYETICNQALVLLTSYFSSTVSDLLKLGIEKILGKNTETPLQKEQIKISFSELIENNFDVKNIAIENFLRTKDISFQDTKTISKAFKDYLQIEIERDENVNEIILGMQCRHVIVHTGAKADTKFLNALKYATPRTLKRDLTIDQKIQFSITEVNTVANAMLKYIENISKEIDRL